jgi:hypothetical protein
MCGRESEESWGSRIKMAFGGMSPPVFVPELELEPGFGSGEMNDCGLCACATLCSDFGISSIWAWGCWDVVELDGPDKLEADCMDGLGETVA